MATLAVTKITYCVQFLVAALVVLDDVAIDVGYTRRPEYLALDLYLFGLDVVTSGLPHERVVDRYLGLVRRRRAVVLELRVRRDLRCRILLAFLRRLLVRCDL